MIFGYNPSSSTTGDRQVRSSSSLPRSLFRAFVAMSEREAVRRHGCSTTRLPMQLLLPSHCVSFCFRRPLLRDIGSVFLSCSIRRCAIYYYCRLCKYYSACKSIDVCSYSFFPSWSSTVRLCWCYSPLFVNSGDSYSVFDSCLPVWRAFCSSYDDGCVRWIQMCSILAVILWASFRSKCPTKLSSWDTCFSFFLQGVSLLEFFVSLSLLRAVLPSS